MNEDKKTKPIIVMSSEMARKKFEDNLFKLQNLENQIVSVQKPEEEIKKPSNGGSI